MVPIAEAFAPSVCIERDAQTLVDLGPGIREREYLVVSKRPHPTLVIGLRLEYCPSLPWGNIDRTLGMRTGEDNLQQDSVTTF